MNTPTKCLFFKKFLMVFTIPDQILVLDQIHISFYPSPSSNPTSSVPHNSSIFTPTHLALATPLCYTNKPRKGAYFVACTLSGLPNLLL